MATLLEVHMLTLTLRRAGPADTEVLYRLVQFHAFETSAWHREDLRDDGSYFCGRGAFASTLSSLPGGVHLVVLSGRVAGFVVVDQRVLAGETHPELAGLLVLPKYRRQGWATRVVQQLLAADRRWWYVAPYRADDSALAYWQAFRVKGRCEVRRLPDAPEAGWCDVCLIRTAEPPEPSA